MDPTVRNESLIHPRQTVIDLDATHIVVIGRNTDGAEYIVESAIYANGTLTIIVDD